MGDGFLKIVVFSGTFLLAVSSTAYEVSVSCMMAYERGGAPAVYESPECTQWVDFAESIENRSSNCQFSTLQGHREYQEDRIACNRDMRMPFFGEYGLNEVEVGIYAVFDGHGGNEASEMASRNFLDYIFLHAVFNYYKQALYLEEKHIQVFQGHDKDEMKHLNFKSLARESQATDDKFLLSILKEALLRTIHDIDLKFSMEAFDNRYVSGTTATVALLVGDQILVTSIGDSKALLCSNGIQMHLDDRGSTVIKLSVEELTKDHHPDRDEEKARIEAAGGFVTLRGVPRVNGILAVSRAIGDIYLKRFGVIPIPEVMGWRHLTTNNRFLVIASDGMFESLNLQAVCDLLWDADINNSSSSCLSSSSLANCIVNTAFNKGSKDNLAAIVVPLKLSASKSSIL